MKENINKDANKIKKINTLNSKIKSVKSLKSEKSMKSSNSGAFKSSNKNKFLRKNETSIENLTKLVNKINRDMVIESIENTQKEMKDRASKVNQKMARGVSTTGADGEEKNILLKKIEKKAQKKEEMNKIKMEEDLPYERIIHMKHEKEEKEKL